MHIMAAGRFVGDSEVQRTMLELLSQLDGFEASNKIKVRRFCSCMGVQHV
jgi:ATP-dependent 26S proteasome regulatory subunit